MGGLGAVATVCALAVALTAAPPPRKRVATLPVNVQGELGADWTRELDAGLAEGLARGQFDVIATDRSCTDAECLRDVTSDADADFVVRSNVSAKDRTYEVTVMVVDPQGSVLAQTRSSCEVCGVQEVREIVSDQAAQLRTKLDALVSGPAVVIVQSVPSEAAVIVDGKPVGTTPLRRTVKEGRHLVRADKDGYVAVEREFVAVAGVQETLEFQLEPVPDIRPRIRPWGWVGVGLGAASLVAGTTFLVLDENPAPGSRCSGDNVDADGNCRFRYDTLTPGLVLTVSGVVLTLAGAAILIALRPRKPKRETATRWSPAGLGVRARF